MLRSTISLNNSDKNLVANRERYSQNKLKKLSLAIHKANHTGHFPKIAIYTAGSYGRLEASEHSDIDLFIVLDGRREQLEEVKVPEIRLLSEIIDIGYNMRFPKFSNDGQFLKILFIDEILEKLGSPEDDYFNHFTARMLLLLESKPIFGEKTYEKILRATVDAYFRDYPHHPADFKPTFLINDILRFWKTLCLNYENKRNQVESRSKIKHKIKNFKLGYSRLMTCFATVALLSTYTNTIRPAQVVKICRMTPMERLVLLMKMKPHLTNSISEVVKLYCWFLRKTAWSSTKLESYFSKKSNRREAFANARKFGDKIFEILSDVDETKKSLRYLVV